MKDRNLKREGGGKWAAQYTGRQKKNKTQYSGR